MKRYNSMIKQMSKRLLAVLSVIVLSSAFLAQSAYGQTEIRYVSQKTGAYANDGRTWATAKLNIQDAINDLVNSGKTGEVWVAEGTYTPTESTESTGGSTLYMSFKIPAGITVRGGFRGMVLDELNPGNIIYAGEKTAEDRVKVDEDNEGHKYQNLKDYYKYRTILSGDLSSAAEFKWNITKKYYETTFYGNSYHVVWFAMNGFDSNGRARALTSEAKLEGCIIVHGHAYDNSLTERKHNAYGGGAYMVANSVLENVFIMNCDASRDGGGIYMDGGGLVRKGYVADCQALGIGVENGFGGGICMEGNGKQHGIVTQTAITNCVGRMGGGLAINNGTASDGKTYLSAFACVINNNTATTEGGGVYVTNGGALGNLTIARNQCNGSGVISNGMATGRAGGLYCRDQAIVANSILWGNETAKNNDIQYASSRSSATNEKKPRMQYCGLSLSDHIDWSGTSKKGIISLAVNNSGSHSSSEGLALFVNPTTTAGHIDNLAINNVTTYNWQLQSESSMHDAGIQLIDLDTNKETDAPEVGRDINNETYHPHSTLGAYVSPNYNIQPEETSTSFNFYVDPDFIFNTHTNEAKGTSWDRPTRFLGNVMELIRLDAASESPQWTGKTINVYVKQGIVNNTNSFVPGRLREISINIPSNVNIYGSYDTSLTGTDLSKRNPVTTPTTISANLMEDYNYNVAHLITLDGVENVLLDGFKISFANAYSTINDSKNQDGAALTIKNSTTGIHMRNLIMSNNQAKHGAVIYADNAIADFENCIFHNNTSNTVKNSGLIYAVNSSNLTFNHCNMLRSVGHASYVDATSHNVWNNSMFYGNLREAQDNTNNCEELSIEAFDGTVANITGSNNMADMKSKTAYPSIFGDIPGATEYNANALNYTYESGVPNGYPRMVNPTKNAGISPNGDVTYYGRATSFEPHNDNPVVNTASYTDADHLTWGTDITTHVTRDYGGLPDIGAVENHKAGTTEGENAYGDGQMPYGEVMYVKDYRNGDGTIDYTAGGDGSSWENAINGNAYYHANGTHDDDPTSDTGEIDHYETNIVNVFERGANVTLPTTVGQSINVLLSNSSTATSTTTYLVYNGQSAQINNKFRTTKNLAEATVFTITYTSSNTDTKKRGYTIQANFGDEKIYMGYSDQTKNASFSDAQTVANKTTWYTPYFSSNNANAPAFANVNGTSNRKYLTSGGLGTSITYFYLCLLNSDTDEISVPVYKAPARGLQYAVNQSNKSFQNEGGTVVQKKRVYVAEGVYTNSTAQFENVTSVSQPYAYMMMEGVDVYGGFPTFGNPGMNERNPKTYTTILQAQEESPFVTYNRPTTDGGDYQLEVSDWGASAKYKEADAISSIGRVLVQPNNFTIETGWDGFTIRHGYLLTAHMDNIGAALTSENPAEGLNPGDIIKAGGAGALIQENGILTNCIVTDNLVVCSPRNAKMSVFGKDKTNLDGNSLYTYHMAGAGILMTGTLNDKGMSNGTGAIVENCEVRRNQIVTKSQSEKPDNIWMYGGGIFQNGGQIYNTIVHDNDMITVKGDRGRYSILASNSSYTNEMILGGVFIASGKFYNNTVVNNVAASLYSAHFNHCIFSGIHVFDAATVYNSIIADNKGRWYYTGGDSPGNGVPVSAFADGASDRNSRNADKIHVTYSFVDVNQGTNLIDLVSKNDTENTNIYLNRAQHSTTNVPGLYTTANIYDHAEGTNKYHLFSGSPAVNAGTDAIPGVTIPEYDAAYTERVQDCTIDIGAHEYNGAFAITPDLTTVEGQAIYYVTPNGKGTASASDVNDPACAAKLQKVIDAAGRYKYLNPGKQVIVKVANSYSSQHPASGNEEDKYNFEYYATRTTDQTSTDTRMWSIIIPRGVEVWGGYHDGTNGFATRDIINNPTYFASQFYNREAKINAITYHVVTFSDYVFDGDGYPYMKGDEARLAAGLNSTYLEKVNTSGSLEDKDVILMSSVLTEPNVKEVQIAGETEHISNRAVLDGIFVSGGQADGKDFVGGTNEKNVNGYGGAAIVTNYAHVRNCILKGNNATYGGALALRDRALVSGCLMIENSADNKGGALYVFEDGDRLSDGYVVETTREGVAPTMDFYMSHVFTSTIVNNTAQQGGGVWFSDDEFAPNVRFNSVAIWQNNATDQPNVSGNAMPNKPENDTHSAIEYYPFAYSAIQNIRAAGTNNISLSNENKKGARFIDKTKDFDKSASNNRSLIAEESPSDPRFVNFGYFGLTNYSMLASNGMPASDYTDLIAKMAVSKADFTDMDRLAKTNQEVVRSYIEIGARALDKVLPNKKLMLRLFVSSPEDVDMDIAELMMNSGDAYYQQEGSSFAYPFQNLQDALDYIYIQRNEENAKNYGTNNLPFEICVSGGTYYPTRDLTGKYGQSLANTFAVPEGVGIYGGFGTNDMGKYTFYGAGYEPDTQKAQEFTDGGDGLIVKANYISDNVIPLGEDTEIYGYTIKQLSINEMLEKRVRYDINANNIIEPWEFLNQTILSGNATNSETDGVYHVVTSVADQNVVGMLPKASIVKDANYGKHNTASPECMGYKDHEEGQTIHLNGITITGGHAHTYIDGSLDEYGRYIYYQGGGLQVDGNRYYDNYNKKAGHPAHLNSTEFNDAHRAAYAVGYRDIPVSITQCKFVNNEAGYGGAISSNGTVDIFASSFEQNLAIQGDEYVTIEVDGTPTEFTVQYPGEGGAILATHQLSIFNTMFENNEARSADYRIDAHKHKTFRVQNPDVVGGVKTMDAAGGAIMIGTEGLFHIVNCDFVKNKANMYPAIFTLNPDSHPYIKTVEQGGDEVDAYTAFHTIQTPDYSQVINSVFWGNEVHPEMLSRHASNPTFMTASKLGVNVGLKGRTDAYNPEFDPDHAPSSKEDLDDSRDDRCKFMECIWFSAYEDGVGFKPKNDYDCRSLDYKPYGHAFAQIADFLDNTYPDRKEGYLYQNCNILLDSDNNSLEGPNFNNPSKNAGVDGYEESADWSPARLNNLTDNGSGRIAQTISTNGESYSCTFNKYISAGDVPVERTYYSNEGPGDYITTGAYTMTHYIQKYPEYSQNLSLGEEYYMESAYDLPVYEADGITPKTDSEGNPVYTHQQLLRISYDPNPTHNQTYIDMGVYEYPHTELKYTTEDECDILWVSSREKIDNGLPDGSDWSQPTSDLQRAIETLLASRNGHRKEIRLMDGTYTPIYTINGNLSFYIDTYYQNNSVMLPDENEDETPDYNLGVKSLTIKGGYSHELNKQYDVDGYRAIIKGQKRTDENGEQWNHLFYIKDATQRYGKLEYNKSNHYGAKIDESTQIMTIPIEIDGVTFINDQAKPGIDGAAIYFADQSIEIEDPEDQTKTTQTSTGASESHISIITYYVDEAKTIPSPNNVPTQYYTRQQTTDSKNQFIINDKTAKFIMSKCTVYGSGSYNNLTNGSGEKNTTSAVYIGQYGGYSLLYNNVFHSNYGKPLQAYNAVTVNNTFGMNDGGLVDLKNHAGTSTVPSSIKNSVLWRNNWNQNSATFGNQFSLDGYDDDAASESIFSHNAYTGAPHDGTDYAATDKSGNPSEIAVANYNVSLAKENSDVIYGPNFLDPENADLSKRVYKIMPSLRLLNKGENTFYNDNVKKEGSNYADGAHDFNISANIYDLAWFTTTQNDAGSSSRIQNDIIDLGAHEYQQDLDRVIYVDPNKAVNGSGVDWSSPFGYGMIQDAIDLAAVYVVNNKYNENGKDAYVFVKGASGTNKGLHTNEFITPRNGVKVYGSISAEYSEISQRSDNVDEQQRNNEDDAFFDAFVKDMLAKREGVASSAASKTTVLGIHTNGTGFDPELEALIDGFDVTATTNSNTTGTITEPVIKIKPLQDGEAADFNPENNLKLALRNIIVHDNDAKDAHVNVVELNNALMYEVLMRDNKVDNSHSVLKIGEYGWLVNATIEGKTTGANNKVELNGHGNANTDEAIATAEGNSHIYYSLVNYGNDAATWKTLSGYNYPLEDKNLNYQLAEGSKHIDALEPMRPSALPYVFESFISTDGDRDLLGNPRYLRDLKPEHGSLLDRGAFETWKVENDFVCGSEGTVKGSGVNVDLAAQFYPHDGSVVYVMEGKSLVIDPLGEGEVKPTAHNPGFMLLQEGASCYGNGRPMTCSYLAIERNIDANGNVISMPYAMNYKGTDLTGSFAGTTRYDSNGILTLNADQPNVYTYNAEKRADWQYTFASESSPCWETVNSGNTVAANNGVLYVPNDGTVATYGYDNDADGTKDCVTLRFTGRGISMTDFVYTEDANAPYKTITLTQHDDAESTNNNGDFTDDDDMGWNCFGSPYLVANFETSKAGSLDTNTEEDNVQALEYAMNTPKTIWEYFYENTTDKVGKFKAINSWGKDDYGTAYTTAPTIILGEAVFAQTATFGDTEALNFERPVYNAERKGKNIKRHIEETGIISQEDGITGISLYTSRRTVTVKGLEGGERISIYDPAGQLYTTATAPVDNYSTTLPKSGIYIIKVDRKPFKVILR